MGAKVVASENFDVVVKAKNEACYAFKAADFGFQQEIAAVHFFQKRGGERVFFLQQTGGAHGEAETDWEPLGAMHPEDIHIAGLMLLFILSFGVQNAHFPDSGDLEGFHHLRAQLIAPYLVVVGSERVGFHQPV